MAPGPEKAGYGAMALEAAAWEDDLAKFIARSNRFTLAFQLPDSENGSSKGGTSSSLKADRSPINPTLDRPFS
jgi:hypothetical protein